VTEKPASIVRPEEARQSLWIFQERMDFKATGEDTGGAFSLFHDTALPGYGPPPHIHHNADEAFYVLERNFIFHTGDRQVRVVPGSFVFIPRGTVHTWRNVGSTPGRMIVVVAPAGAERFFLEAGVPAIGDSLEAPEPNVERILELAAKYGTEVVSEAG
jgi:mannose-6-phosphate isomerase-like protein (cupin superfamily)